MVNEEDIRLANDGPETPQNPLTAPNWGEKNRDNGDTEFNDTPDTNTPEAADPQPEEPQNEEPQSDPVAAPSASDNAPENTGGTPGREVKPYGADDAANEGTDPADEAESEDAEEQAGEEKELPSKIGKELDKQGEAGTEQPWGLSFDTGNGWLMAGLALVLVLLACLVADTIRRSRKKKRHRTAPAPVAYSGDGAVSAAVHQDIGAREDQQDSYGVSRPELYAQQGVMAVVADGMGGLANGKAVSSALVRTFIDGFPQVSGYYTLTQDILLDLSIRANAQINQMLRGADRSGSTLVAALVRDGYLHFLTVGDSRIYLYRGGALLQLNREHIYQEELAVKAVNQAVSMGQVRSDRQAHSLTSYFGIGRIPSIDRNDEGIRLVSGDRILLASDGVFGTLTREQMEQALRNDISEAAKQIGDMIRTEDKPYQDNNTLVILEYKG